MTKISRDKKKIDISLSGVTGLKSLIQFTELKKKMWILAKRQASTLEKDTNDYVLRSFFNSKYDTSASFCISEADIIKMGTQ